MDRVNLRDELARVSDHWSPKVVGGLNGRQAKQVKFAGGFVWHHHADEDELFLVVAGRFRTEFRDRHVWLVEGEFLIVPRVGSGRRTPHDPPAIILPPSRRSHPCLTRPTPRGLRSTRSPNPTRRAS
jgi:quercetin dioxygenase-like cupin family protein